MLVVVPGSAADSKERRSREIRKEEKKREGRKRKRTLTDTFIQW